MKFTFLFLLSALFISPAEWGTDFEKAKQAAVQEHKFILLNFSGSDWCGPCIRMHNEIFEKEEFKNFAETNLVLVNADFPRQKKNQLSKEQQKKNDHLADQYDPKGIFPYTILLSADGKAIREWEGFPNISPEEFISQIKKAIDASK